MIVSNGKCDGVIKFWESLPPTCNYWLVLLAEVCAVHASKSHPKNEDFGQNFKHFRRFLIRDACVKMNEWHAITSTHEALRTDRCKVHTILIPFQCQNNKSNEDLSTHKLRKSKHLPKICFRVIDPVIWIGTKCRLFSCQVLVGRWKVVWQHYGTC